MKTVRYIKQAATDRDYTEDASKLLVFVCMLISDMPTVYIQRQ